MPFRIEHHFQAEVHAIVHQDSFQAKASCNCVSSIIIKGKFQALCIEYRFHARFHVTSHRISFSSGHFMPFRIKYHFQADVSCDCFMPFRIEYHFHAEVSCYRASGSIIFKEKFYAISHRISFSSGSFMPFRIEYHFHAHVSCQFAPNIIFMHTFHAISH